MRNMSASKQTDDTTTHTTTPLLQLMVVVPAECETNLSEQEQSSIETHILRR
jgi:hypothetical protein